MTEKKAKKTTKKSAKKTAKKSVEIPTVSDEQLVRSVRSFEAIMISQIEIGDKLGDDLKAAIRVGMVVLGMVAVSILVLLLTLSSQVNRISSVVKEMNTNFTSVSMQMDVMSLAVSSMSHRVALLNEIDQQTGSMYNEMENITSDLQSMDSTVNGISKNVTVVRHNVQNISNSMNHMDDQVQLMSRDMHHMSQPARSINKMFPIP